MNESPTPELSEIAISAWASLLRSSQALLAAVEAGLKAQGLPPLSWYDALLELRSERNGLRPFQLQERMLLTQYNISRLLDRLVAAGYVNRLPCPDDGRGHIVRVTPAGRALLKRMWPAYKALIAEIFSSRLNDTECRTIAGLMAKLRCSSD